MARGGKREGAGRKLGSVAKTDKEARERALESGESPLDYMLRIMRDESAEAERRDRMAASAAPYVHSKLASVEHSGPAGEAIRVVSETVVRGVRPNADH